MQTWSVWAPLEITLPVFLMVLLGVYLRRRNAIDDAFISVSSKLVFNLALPALMFIAVATARLDVAAHWPLITFALLAGTGAAVLAFIWASVSGLKAGQHGAFVQASFRSNLGIVGLALCIAAFHEEGAALGALILAVVTPLYNLLSVWVLGRHQAENWTEHLINIAKNPLVIALLAALLVQWSGFTLPPIAERAGRWLGQMALPLALIGSGGSISQQLRGSFGPVVLQTVLLKLVLLPGFVVLMAAIWGFRGTELGVITLMFASPTAAAAFVMAKAMNSDALLTARSIALTTLGSLLSISGFLYVLILFGLV
ncbi:AEC family transporter [Thalassolituus sp. LLYu03]|uniref:AEC family transporter n=1 Tax=Thalassolituus sp. LLYu03 TaxID=3421656 RepID=UPI003D297198